MNRRRLALAVPLATVVLGGSGVADGASSDAGRYAGKATKGTTTTAKGTKLAFAVKVMENCPMGDGKFKKALCLTWTPGISMPIVCEYWNDADPTHRPANERRAVPAAAAVSARGKVDLKVKSSGSGYSDATRLTVTLHDGKATGRVTYTATGRSSIVSKDCTGRLEFTAKRR
ncbi:hypothetical protein [Baekduia sp. Peel2402]|uniref:hypothetical protein n=1 Tax=Baekduia sp. Peel2402 TaxID=3458296 RepID=UPI00403EF44F